MRTHAPRGPGSRTRDIGCCGRERSASSSSRACAGTWRPAAHAKVPVQRVGRRVPPPLAAIPPAPAHQVAARARPHAAQPWLAAAGAATGPTITPKPTEAANRCAGCAMLCHSMGPSAAPAPAGRAVAGAATACIAKPGAPAAAAAATVHMARPTPPVPPLRLASEAADVAVSAPHSPPPRPPTAEAAPGGARLHAAGPSAAGAGLGRSTSLPFAS